MDSDEITATAYLQQLYNSTQGNTETQVSMYDLGLAIGIDKAEAGRVAEGLMVQGYIELKTLAGGISITEEGLGFLGFSRQDQSNQDQEFSFSPGPIVSETDRNIAQKIITNIQHELTRTELDYTTIEQIVLDIKAIELHLLSLAPKCAVLLALFSSIADSLAGKEEILKRTGLTALSQ